VKRVLIFSLLMFVTRVFSISTSFGTDIAVVDSIAGPALTNNEVFYNAIRSADYKTVLSMVVKGIDVNQVNGNGDTPLYVAAHHDRPATTELLLEAGAKINTRNSEGRTALHIAISNYSFDALPVLMDYGASLTILDDRGRSPLLTAFLDDQQAFEYFGAYDSLVDFDGFTIAALTDSDKKLREYLRNGWSGDDMNEGGWNVMQLTVANPPMYSNYFDYNPIILIDKSQNLNVLTPKGDNLVNLAAAYGSKLSLRHLIKKRRDVNHANKLGETPLMQACRRESRECVELLLEANANLNAEDIRGWTPLMYAAEQYSGAYLVRMLLDRGADPKKTNKAGQTALDIATKMNCFETIQVLQKIKLQTKTK